MNFVNFDRRMKELSRAHDAIDRLREVHQRNVERDALAQEKRERLVRLVVAAALGLLVVFAIYRL